MKAKIDKTIISDRLRKLGGYFSHLRNVMLKWNRINRIEERLDSNRNAISALFKNGNKLDERFDALHTVLSTRTYFVCRRLEGIENALGIENNTEDQVKYTEDELHKLTECPITHNCGDCSNLHKFNCQQLAWHADEYLKLRDFTF